MENDVLHPPHEPDVHSSQSTVQHQDFKSNLDASVESPSTSQNSNKRKKNSGGNWKPYLSLESTVGRRG